MTDYIYKAVDTRGRVIKGTRIANGIAELELRLRRSGLELLVARESSPKGSIRFFSELGMRLGSVKRQELIEFSNNMGVMLKAGVPLMDALIELREDQENRFFKGMLDTVVEEVSAGDPLNASMRKKPKCFPPLYASIIEIGENTGRLDTAFFDLAKHYKRIDDLNKNARKALIYPSFVVAVLFLVAIVFLGKVFPVIFSMFDEFNITDLPPVTRVFVALSNIVENNWQLIVLGILIFIVLIYYLRRVKRTRYYFDWLEINIPYVKGFFLQLRMAFFARYLSMLQSAGVDILRSLELAIQSINNLVLQKILKVSRDRVEGGTPLSSTLKENRFIPNMVVRMISVGEAAGTLPEQLEFVADYYDEGLERKIAFALALMEPILIVLLAGVAMALVMAVLLPAYNILNQVFGGYGVGG